MSNPDAPEAHQAPATHENTPENPLDPQFATSDPWLDPKPGGLLTVVAVAMGCWLFLPLVFVDVFQLDPLRLNSPQLPSDLLARTLLNLGVVSLSLLAGVAMYFFVARAANRQSGRSQPLLNLVSGFNPGRAAGVAAVVTAIAIPATYAASSLTAITLRWLGYPLPGPHPMLEQMAMEPRVIVVMLQVLTAVVVVPVFEEFVFRGMLQTWLRGFFSSKWPAIILVSLIFAFIHAWWTRPSIFVLSLGIGLAFERARTLWAPILVHAAFNGTSTAMFLLLKPYM